MWLSLVVGLLMIPFTAWATVEFNFDGGPHSRTSLVLVFLVMTAIGLMGLSTVLFAAWLRAAFLAKIYRKAAEDGRGLAQELGFMDRDE